MALPAKPPPPADTAPGRPDSTWTPMRHRVFRWIWLATLVSNIGTWMQTVGAQWLLVGRPHASALVALVQTATTLPVLLFALPAGVLADVVDRRKLLIASQIFQTTVAAVMAVLAATGHLPPALLLGLTFALGLGATFSLPAQQAITPELVPRADLPGAAALNGMNMNFARAVGPALAGAAVARLGPGAVFALNAASFVALAVVLARWRRPVADSTQTPERLLAALMAGTRYIRHSPVIRRILLAAALFVLPASAIWALLPVVANHTLGLGAGGYGVLLGALGAGAIAGVVGLSRLRSRLTEAGMMRAAFGVFALAMLAVSLVRNPTVVGVCLIPAGAAWIAVLASLNAAMQLFLPGWVRARGLSIYQIVLLGGMAVASAAWGIVAEQLGVPVALRLAAIGMAVGLAGLLRWPLIPSGHLDRSLAVYWPEPHLVLEPDPDVGPVQVMATLRVAPENVPAFIEAMERVRRVRRRTGAVRWELYRSGSDPEVFVEEFLVRSWDEHLRQHQGRLTVTDQEIEAEAEALAEGPATITHLFPPWVDGG